MNDNLSIREARREDFAPSNRLVFDSMMPGLPDMAWNKRTSKIAIAKAADNIVGMIVGHTVPVTTGVTSTENPFKGIYALEALATNSWLISCLGVDRDWKNSGIERQLLAFAEGLAVAEGAEALSTVFGRVQPDLVPFFENEGFSIRAERDGLYSLGLPVTWVLMTREFMH